MQKHIIELDGLRGLAILMVVIYHYFTSILPATFPLHGLIWYGRVATSLFWSGVDLFFVLSGFLVGGILIDNYKADNFYGVFYLRRACRILPAYLVVLTVFLIVVLTMGDRYSWINGENTSFFSYLTFTQNIVMGIRGRWIGNALDVTWSVAVEGQFYLFLPMVLFLMGLRRAILLLCPLIVLSAVLRLWFNGHGSLVNMPFRMEGLLLGVLLAYVLRRKSVMDLLRQHAWLPWFVFLVLLFGMMRATLRNVLGYLDFAFLACFYTAFVTLVVTRSGGGGMFILRSRSLRFLGQISYGLYLYHILCCQVLHALILGRRPSISDAWGVGVTVLALIVSIGLAATSYHLIERPFLRFGHRHSYRVRETQPGPC